MYHVRSSGWRQAESVCLPLDEHVLGEDFVYMAALVAIDHEIPWIAAAALLDAAFRGEMLYANRVAIWAGGFGH